MSDLTKKNYNGNSRGLTSPSGTQIVGTVSTLFTFTEEGTSSGFPVRSIRCDAAGVFEYTDWDDTTHTLNVLQAETLPISPKTVTAATAVAWIGYY